MKPELNEATEEEYELYANELDDAEVIDILEGDGLDGEWVL